MASRKMQVNRLNQEELNYELQIRGIATGTVEQMRQALTMAMRLEKSGDSIKYPAYPFTEQEDISAVTKKLGEIEPEIVSFQETLSSGLYLKFQSKLSHVLGRIDNIPLESAERPNVLARALTLLDQLHQKAEENGKSQAVPPQMSLMESLPAAANFAAVITPSRRSSGVPAPQGTVPSGMKPVPPSKWGITFSGDKKSMSLSAFLERVEELRVARHVPKDTLLESGIDLFSGRAYQFYTAYRDQVNSWDEFLVLLREEYLTPNYNEKLFDEIRKRTQGPDESIAIYMAVMTGYFNRLTCSISEETKLKIILRNLAPYYQSHLALVTVNSLSELRELGRRLEAGKEAMENFVPPSRRGAVMEPDLAYVEVGEDVPVDVCDSSLAKLRSEAKPAARDIICYRCNQPGHRAVGCLLSKGKFCYRCKREGYTVRTCPNCSKQGN